MSAIGRLDQIEARANAATEGPWHEWGHDVVRDCGHCTCGTGGTSYGHESGCGAEQVAQASDPDAEFIAHARTDVPALVAALRAVLELHAGLPYDYGIDPFGRSRVGATCLECAEEHPCPTVRAIEEALT